MKTTLAAALALLVGGLIGCETNHRDIREAEGTPMTRGGDRDASTRLQSDPVCGMTVNPRTAIKETYDNQTFYFDSEECAEKFRENPHAYLPGGDDRPGVRDVR